MGQTPKRHITAISKCTVQKIDCTEEGLRLKKRKRKKTKMRKKKESISSNFSTGVSEESGGKKGSAERR